MTLLAYQLLVCAQITLTVAFRAVSQGTISTNETGIAGLTLAGAKIGFGIFNDVAKTAEEQVNGNQKDGQTLHNVQFIESGITWDKFLSSWPLPNGRQSMPKEKDGISFEKLAKFIGAKPTFSSVAFTANGKNPFESGRDTFGNWFNGKGGREIGQVNVYGLDKDTETALMHASRPISWTRVKDVLLGRGYAPIYTEVHDTAIVNAGMSNSIYTVVGKVSLKHFAHEGCYKLSRAECCEYVDGRSSFKDQDCVPAPAGETYSWGAVCEPNEFVKNKILAGMEGNWVANLVNFQLNIHKYVSTCPKFVTD